MGKFSRRFATVGIVLLTFAGLFAPKASARFIQSPKCGIKITEDTHFGGNVDCSTASKFPIGENRGVIMASDNVTLDLGGYKVIGPGAGTTTVGIDTDGTAQTFITGGGYTSGPEACPDTGGTRGTVQGFGTGIRVNSLIDGLPAGLGYVSDVNRICIRHNHMGVSIEGLVPLTRVRENWINFNGGGAAGLGAGINISPALVLDISVAPRVEANDIRKNEGPGIQINNPTVSVVQQNVLCGNTGPGIKAVGGLPTPTLVPTPLLNLIASNVAGRPVPNLGINTCSSNSGAATLPPPGGVDLLDQSAIDLINLVPPIPLPPPIGPVNVLGSVLNSPIPCVLDIWVGNRYNVIPGALGTPGTPRVAPGCVTFQNANSAG